MHMQSMMFYCLQYFFLSTLYYIKCNEVENNYFYNRLICFFLSFCMLPPWVVLPSLLLMVVEDSFYISCENA